MKNKQSLMVKLHYLNDEMYSRLRVKIHPPLNNRQNLLLLMVVQDQMQRTDNIKGGFVNDK